MEPLVTPADLAEYMGDPALEADPEALVAVRLASGEIRAFCGQEFTPVTDDEVVLDGTGSGVLLLPELPVLDVSLLEEGPGGARSTLAGPADPSPSWEWSEDGVLRRLGGGRWIRRFRWYRAVYSHGWEPIHDGVQSVALRIAARSIENPGELRSETLGRYSYTQAGADAGVGLFRPDERSLAPFVIGSAPRPRAASGAGSGSGS